MLAPKSAQRGATSLAIWASFLGMACARPVLPEADHQAR
jgi:hypothetical protein